MIQKVLLFTFLLFNLAVNSQDNNLWKEVSKSHSKSKDKNVIPYKYKVYKLDLQLLKDELEKAPRQRENINLSTFILGFPDENGMLKKYKIAEASVMDRELQENHLEIRSYIGKSIDNSNSIIRFSISPYGGFNGIILNNSVPPTLIERNGNYYHIFSKKDLPYIEDTFKCGAIDKAEPKGKNDSVEKTLINGQLRTYRLALATTGEYSQYILNDLGVSNTASDEDKKNAILGHLNSVITSVNAVFERDVSITMQLVADSEGIIFLDATTDNLDNSPNSLEKNQEVCDNVIGDSNYDIGHLLVTESNVNVAGAAIGFSACSSSKAKGVSSFVRTAIPSKYYRILLHELGHQFGAKHTFYEIFKYEEGVEVGKGHTIMSYGGAYVELFFHSISVKKIKEFTQNRVNCASITNTGNTPPIANAGNNFIVPKSTPFLLEGTASDSGSSPLTYTWEQIDSEKGIFPLLSFAPKGPVFRWLPPITEPKRYIPNINTILNGKTSNTLEVVPSVSRRLNFAFTVRDNDTRGGEISEDQMAVTVDGNSGPFIVTSHNNSPSTWYSGWDKTVLWDVANTDSGTVNTPTVDILFSTDGGRTYSTILASNVTNNGSYSFKIPFGIATTQGRFMIKGYNNIFLDVNNANITVEEKEFLVNINDMEIEKSLCLASSNSISYDFTYNSYSDFNSTVNFSASNLNGASISFSPNSTNTDGANITMTISNISLTNVGSNTISITASLGDISFTNRVALEVYDDSPLSTVSLISPSDGATNTLEPFTFQWNAENNANSYIIEISTDSDFSDIVENTTVYRNSFTPNSLNYNTTYYWHIKAVNTCVSSVFSNTFSFTTLQSAHTNDTYIPDDVFEQFFIDLGYDSEPLDNYVPTRAVKSITELLIPSLNISNLTGIEDFTALTHLDCYDNPISVLDVSSNTALTYLSCPSITALDVSKNTNLTELYLTGPITVLDVSKNTALTDLRFVFTELTHLDLSKNTQLTKLSARFNYSLTSLNLKNGNNTLLTDFSSFRNDLLRCIQVDDEVWSTNNWRNRDSNSFFSKNCNSLSLINEGSNMASFYVSPNPVTDILYIESDNNIKIERVKIFNTLGKLIYHKRNKNNQIDFSDFSKGVYILKLIDMGEKSIIRKIIKK